MIYRFYKNEVGQWFIDLPAYIEEGGKKSNLQMVEGADKMLELLAEGRDEVVVEVETGSHDNYSWEEGGNLLVRTQIHTGNHTGASYTATMPINDVEVFDVWLCDVTKFVFGDFPEVIYVKRANT